MNILTYLAGIVDGEGCIHIVKVKPSGNNISTRIDWQSQKAKDILVKLSPLLIGKKQQAKIGIQFQELVESHSTPGRKLTSEILSERDKFYVTMAQLKLNP